MQQSDYLDYMHVLTLYVTVCMCDWFVVKCTSGLGVFYL